MSELNAQALLGLRNTVVDLLPDSPPGVTPPMILINPTKVAPAGLNGFVGLHPDPFGEIYGATVDARVIVQVRADSLSDLNSVLTDVTNELMALDRQELASQRIMRLRLVETSDIHALDDDDFVRELKLDVIYEYLQLPESSGETIDTVLLEDDVSLPGRAEFIIDQFFEEDPLVQFDIVDDPLANSAAPSAWSYDAAEDAIEQGSRIRGGSQTLSTPRKAGTYLVLQTSSSIPETRNFIFTTELQSQVRNGIGVVFRWQDENNFYFFLMSDRFDYRIFGKKVDGDFEFFAEGGRSETEGYAPDTRYELKIIAENDQFQAQIDGEPVLSGRDEDIDSAGRVGFMTHRNDGARFYRLRLVGFDG